MLKADSKIWIIVIITIGLISVPLVLYIIKFGTTSLSRDFKQWNSFAQFISNVIGPCIAFITLMVTSWIAVKFNSFQKQQTVIKLFKEFRSQEMLSARTTAWAVKENWFDSNKPEYKDAFIEAMISEKPPIIIYPNNTIEQVITTEQVRAVFELFEFYRMLSTYGEQDKIIYQLNYFYYAWWRKFLYEVAEEYDSRREEQIKIMVGKLINRKCENKDLERKEFKQFKDNNQFTPLLRKLDNICEFNIFKKDKKPIDIYG